MKIFKSIKWRLQLWYGVILVVVLAGFGFTAYHLERGRALGRIDDELHRRVEVLKNALHRQQPRGPNGNWPFPGQPPRRQNLDDPPFNRPPDGQLPEDDPLGLGARPPGKFSLPQDAEHFFEASDTNGFYYVITRGNEIVRSTNAPVEAIVFYAPGFMKRNTLPVLPQNGSPPQYNGDFIREPDGRPQIFPIGQPGPAWMRATFREIRMFPRSNDPNEISFLVGKNIAPELKELHRTALNLAVVGGLILLIGLAGGGWLVSQSLKPISIISITAIKISAGDLSQRIDVAEAESELGQLAAVLNSTFARLEAAFAQQQQFTSDAAHELRTPVSVMLTQSQAALNRERTAPEYRETVEACQRAAQRMRRLIESLLALARLDAGQEPMKQLDFDLSNTARDCVELVRPLADERGLKIICDLPPLECVGDSERLAQVVTNLLTNAIQYNKPNGEVRVKAESQSGMAILTVSDTGRGIAAEDLPRVFERFYRADKSRSTGGNGLGLAISKAVVEAHGGTIKVSSAENTGTTFTVRLPIQLT